jgi:uncharacterized SAM-binding protein YcdF (DUF218 family)
MSRLRLGLPRVRLGLPRLLLLVVLLFMLLVLFLLLFLLLFVLMLLLLVLEHVAAILNHFALKSWAGSSKPSVSYLRSRRRRDMDGRDNPLIKSGGGHDDEGRIRSHRHVARSILR